MGVTGNMVSEMLPIGVIGRVSGEGGLIVSAILIADGLLLVRYVPFYSFYSILKGDIIKAENSLASKINCILRLLGGLEGWSTTGLLDPEKLMLSGGGSQVLAG